MHRWTRWTLSGAAVVGLAAGLLAIGTAVGAPPVQTERASVPRPSSPLARSVADLQRDLARRPGDANGWSELGLAYVEQARSTADPTLYDKATGAFERSLAVRPRDNDVALTGKATLAATRHDFAGALSLTDASLRVNAQSPTTWAVRSDALNELGRYDEARDAVQRLLDLSPDGVGGLTRASYVLELRGDVTRARELLVQAAEVARRPQDRAFAQYYLGELAWNGGDLEAAAAAYEQGLREDTDSPLLAAGRAKVLAADGDVPAAVEEYRRVVERLPAPEHLVALGELLESSGRTAEAEEQYAVVRAVQRLYAANGQDVDTELALFEADHGTPQAAVASAGNAYAKRPHAVLTQDAYAWALHAAGRSEQALPVARAASRLGLRSPVLAYHLGVIEAAAGDRDAARAALRRALDLNPRFNPLQAPAARTLLDSLSR